MPYKINITMDMNNYHFGWSKKYFDKEIDKRRYLHLMENEKFQSMVEDSRKKHEIDPYYFEELNDDEWEQQCLPLLGSAHVLEDAENIVSTLGLGSHWTEYVRDYIVLDQPYPNRSPEALMLKREFTDHGTSKYFLRITKETTLKEIKQNWSDIQKEIDGSNTRLKKSENTFRNWMIYRWDKKGHTVDEIYRKCLNKYDEDLDYGHIKTIISNFKKKVKNSVK